ncbi:YbdD/YjiX family protein [Chitiniphilus eburneus]|uniref:YbdD/YjiX family protein n=1 Tax=Chitiniphilus eburneus TaxID=2571148 RepID=A0A4U0Q2L4_9NEIS|nr:YbdD/YjiX family protein [Chitiniphilus eburneus]TJZ74282.1 YbdD/YjiX family protein [Chitiniphilus eburneus]
MLDLSFLNGGRQAPPPQAPEDDYARYLAEHRAQHRRGEPMSRETFERYSLGSDWLGGLKDAARKVVQTCRLMVGIHDYEYYLAHMRERHPDAEPMSRAEFYRHCLEARFPSADGAGGGRCPC